MDHHQRHFALFLVPGFSLVALSCVIDTLRAANADIDQNFYKWTLIGDRVTSVVSSSDIQMPCRSNTEVDMFDTLVICGGDRSHVFDSKTALNWLAACPRPNVSVGSISDGSYVAAAAGLFDKCRCTIHWKCQSAFRERHPKLDIRKRCLGSTLISG